MRRLFLIALIVSLFGCGPTLPKSEILVRYQLKGEVVDVYYGNHKMETYFVIDREELENFIERENLKTATSGNLTEE